MHAVQLVLVHSLLFPEPLTQSQKGFQTRPLFAETLVQLAADVPKQLPEDHTQTHFRSFCPPILLGMGITGLGYQQYLGNPDVPLTKTNARFPGQSSQGATHFEIKA
jgi:hypothetical protein